VSSSRSRRLAVAAAAVLGLGAFTTTADAAAPDPAKPVASVKQRALNPAARAFTNPVAAAKGARQAWFVQLRGSGAADAAQRAGGSARGVAAARTRRAQVKTVAARVLSSARAADPKAASMFTVSNAIPGMGLQLDTAGVKALVTNPDVVKVSRIVPKHPENSNVATLIQAVNTWHFSGTGQGVSVGVIDSGLDYTHADFGGPGTVAAYEAAHAKETSPTWRTGLGKRAQRKLLGGYDFVGDSYNADPNAPAETPYQPIPHPDNNPLDCADNGHGTHVAGTVAGYGVTAEGKTLNPKKLTKLNGKRLKALKIGPGMAPKAQLYPLRVFGCAGSTDMVIPALDKALDPNGDGLFDDHLDIVNMSLGSDYAPVDDPENAIVDELTAHGVLSVIAAGNNGDLTDTVGSPGNAVSSLSVASSVDSYQLRDGIRVNAPGSVAGVAPGQNSIAYDWTNNGPTHAPVTGPVTPLSAANADGCAALSGADAAAVAGKVAWLTWDSNDATRKCGSVARSANVKAAGAIGAIFTGDVEPFGAGITGDPTIPVFQLTKAATASLQPAAVAGTLNVTFDGKLAHTAPTYDDALTDTLSSFSSRGTHGSLGVVKPDVTAPGDTLASAAVGTGNDVLVESGTSMATPTTAGVAALVKAAHPKWSPLKVKTTIMNTARHDLYTGQGRTGKIYGPARVGAGRIDAAGAVRNRVLASVDDGTRGVSASFGVVEAPISGGTITRTRVVTVQNTGKKKAKVSLSYQAVNQQPGVSYSVSPSKVKIRPKKSKKVTVTMTVDPTALRRTIDPTMAAQQTNVYYGQDEPRQFVPDASGRLLVAVKGKNTNRLPVYGTAKPVSQTKSSVVGSNLVVSGQGVATGGTSSADYNSLLSVLQLGATSPQLPVCADEPADGCVTGPTDRSMDLQYVGAGSTNGADGTLFFGIATYADWASIGTAVIPYVDFSTDSDPEPEYETYVQTIEGSDLLYAWTVELGDLTDPDDDTLVDLEPVNFQFADTDTNVFDTNVITFGLFKDAAGLPASGSAPITYTVGTVGPYSEIDSTGPISYDAGTPTLGADGELFADKAGTSVPLTGSGAAQALVLHLHGAKGSRAEVVNRP
jgi:subtilisin family serine protease